jgi:hypothetical protein
MCNFIIIKLIKYLYKINRSKNSVFKFFLFLFIIILFGCEHTGQWLIPTDYSNKICSNQLVERNGYSKHECVEGAPFAPDFYYKIVFITKEHGTLVTKYAYSMKIGSYMCRSCMDLSYFIPCRCIFIRRDDQLTNFIRGLLKILETEFNDYYYYHRRYKNNPNELLLYDRAKIILFLNKKEYDAFIINYRDIKILNF